MDIINPHMFMYIHIHTILWLWLYMWRNDIIIYTWFVCLYSLYICVFPPVLLNQKLPKKKTNASKSQAFGHDLHTKLMRCIAVRRLGSRLRRLRLGWRMRLFWRRNRWNRGSASRLLETHGGLNGSKSTDGYIWWLSTWWSVTFDG